MYILGMGVVSVFVHIHSMRVVPVSIYAWGGSCLRSVTVVSTLEMH